MKINFHFQTPLDCSSLISAERLYNICKIDHPEIDFSYYDYRKTDFKEPIPIEELSKFKHNYAANAFIIIENDENKKYFLISYADTIRTIFDPFFDLENCVELFASIGVHDNNMTYTPLDIKYTPIGYFQDQKRAEDKSQELYKINNPKIIPDKLYFRTGNPYLFRKYLINDDRFDIRVGRTSPEDFITEMSKYLINIDINSVAEISCRTADAFALGSALIRPKLSIKYHNKLIPDYHYAAIKCDDLSDYPMLADSYIERFEELKKDPDFTNFISINGRKWYEENCTIDAHVNILKKLIDFNKLK